MSVRFAAAIVSTWLYAIPAFPQQLDRRAREEPEVAIEAGGRSGYCDVLQFTPDGRFLLAAGDDKVVHVWPHSVDGLDTTPGKVQTLRWRSWRDQLGGIKAVGVSPDGKRVAVGGYGLRISSVALIDRGSGDTIAITWPKTEDGGSNFDAVLSIAFHPDGKRIAFRTADGSLWFWDPIKLATADPRDPDRVWSAPLRVGRLELPEETPPINCPGALHFRDAETLLSVTLDGRVIAYKLDGSDLGGTPLLNVYKDQKRDYPILRAEWSGDGKWLVAGTAGPLLLVCSMDGKQTVRLELPPAHLFRGLAIHPKSGKVAVGVGGVLPPGDARFVMEGKYEVWLYDNPTANPLVAAPEPTTKIPHAGRVEAVAFHPENDRLAVAGGDADEVVLLDLASPRKPLSVVRGAGRHLWGVNLSEDGTVLGVQTGRNVAADHPNKQGDGAWVGYNVRMLKAMPVNGIKWIDPLTTSDGWRIVPDAKSRSVWYAERLRLGGQKETIRLGLDPDLDVIPTCFTFVPTPEGKPARVLVGHYYGCSLFELDPGRVTKNRWTKVIELPRSRLFIGHGAEVTSIVADRKGTWFVTASSDQTVAGWSLTDWTSQAAFGAAFEARDDHLLVTSVDVGSPAWEAGLTRGDPIDRLGIDAEWFYDGRKGKTPLRTARDAATALLKPQPGVELVFSWIPAGQVDRRRASSRVKQRPLWKWFPAFDERNKLTDSVIWMWHGSCYFTESTHGDRMIGWHVNHPDVSGSPDYYPLERFKEQYLKPGVLFKLVGTRSVAEALKDVQEDNAQQRSFRDFEPEPLTLALKQAEVRGDGIPLTVTVNPRGKNPDLLVERVELWVNDHRYREWPAKGIRKFAEEVVIPASAFRAGDNQITVLTITPALGRGEVKEHVNNPASAGKADLHGVAVGINNYDEHRKAVGTRERAFGNLAKACADASSFTSELLTYRGPTKCFPKGNVALFLDAKADRKSILSALEELRQPGAVKPDDQLVIFFAGHGAMLKAGGKIPLQPGAGRGLGGTSDSGLFVFCCPNYLPQKAHDTALSGEELFEALAKINCRKLVLLDACHAGGVLETNQIRRFIPNGQGPTVIAACDANESSFEDDKLKHGVFTFAVLEAFGAKFHDADSNSDGKLSPEELFNYVSERVPILMRDVNPNNTQTPISFPQPNELPRTAFITR